MTDREFWRIKVSMTSSNVKYSSVSKSLKMWSLIKHFLCDKSCMRLHSSFNFDIRFSDDNIKDTESISSSLTMRWAFICFCKSMISVFDVSKTNLWLDVKNKHFDSIYSILTSWVKILIKISTNFRSKCFLRWKFHLFIFNDLESSSINSSNDIMSYKKISLIEYNDIDIVEIFASHWRWRMSILLINDVNADNENFVAAIYLQSFMSWLDDWHVPHKYLYLYKKNVQWSSKLNRLQCSINISA